MSSTKLDSPYSTSCGLDNYDYNDDQEDLDDGEEDSDEGKQLFEITQTILFEYPNSVKFLFLYLFLKKKPNLFIKS